MDPFGMIESLDKVRHFWINRGEDLEERWLSLIDRLQDATLDALKEPIYPEAVPDTLEAKKEALLETVRRQSSLARKYHMILGGWIQSLVDSSQGLQEKDRVRARFWARQWIAASNPSNFFWTNPYAVRKFLDSSGSSFLQGMANWWEDACERNFMPRIVDESSYAVGVNIAVTPGAVVFRNVLMELIQYEASTAAVYRIPVVLIPPWINKYYIFDLLPENSLVRYLRDQGFTVFVVSWKNPSSDMRGVAFDDYMMQGAHQAVGTAREICRTQTVHAVGYCIGGTVLSALMAWHHGGPGNHETLPVADWTLFSSLVDFSAPGDLGVFISLSAIEAVESLMRAEGLLDKRYIGLVFRLLGSDSLIWRNFIHGYLYGAAPLKSEMLFWNTDGTHLPEAMCSFYLREFYLHNRLAQRSGVTLVGRSIDLKRITQPLYAVGAQLDHICPWQGTFRTGRLISGPTRYTLSSEGHITGIINPPSERSRRRYWTGIVSADESADEWFARQREQRGSWWDDWTSWLRETNAEKRKPPALGSRQYPPLEPSPGSYVLEK